MCYRENITNQDQNKLSLNQGNQKNARKKKYNCLIEGNGIIQKSYAMQKHLIQYCLMEQIRVTYLTEEKKKKNQILQQNSHKVQVIIFPQTFANPQQFQSKILQKVEHVYLDQRRENFFVGNLKTELIKLSGNLTGITAQVKFNDIFLNDPAVAPMHLEVNYSSLTKNKNFIFQLNSVRTILQNSFKTQSISERTFEKISNYLYVTKRKLKISDVSKRLGPPIFIQIQSGFENCILEEGQNFRIGFQSLIVEKMFVKVEHFFRKYSRKNHNSNSDMIFDSLQSMQKLVSFAGIDVALAELFMLVQERDISKKEYQERFLEDNLMLNNKINIMLQKNCIFMRTQGDQYRVENFLLVADQKFTFNFGRMDYSDIQFSSSQVSRAHGLIEYNHNTDQWAIMDGVFEDDQWKPSTFGLWLEIQKGKYYYIDPNQSIRIGNNYSLKFEVQNDSDSKVEVNQKDYYYYQKQQNIDQFLISCL